MALGKYSRVDGRKSSSYCSTITVVVFVGVCLVGVWMLMTSSVVPVQNSDFSSQEAKTELEQKVTENNPNQFEDNPGDLPDDAVKEEGSLKNDRVKSNTGENTVEETQEEKFVKENTEGKTETEAETKEAEHDGEGNKEKLDSNSNEESNSGDGDSNSESGEATTEGSETNSSEQSESQESTSEKKSDIEENADERKHEDEVDSRTEEKIEENQDKDSEERSGENKMEDQEKNQDANDIFPAGVQSEILNETTTQNGPWSTQATESENEKEAQKVVLSTDQNEYKWKVLEATMNIVRGTAQMKLQPALLLCQKVIDNQLNGLKAENRYGTTMFPTQSLQKLRGIKTGLRLLENTFTFPGGGTQFKNGALHYIDSIQKSLPQIDWGKRSRVILDVGCGVASFGGYLFDRDVLAMSFAPKDEHEAQVQFALERGIPAISAVMGTNRLPFPSKVFDVVHCARCRVPWHVEGGKLLLELNRVLRPGGYFVWSATPVYRTVPEDVAIWKAMSELTKSMCWDLVMIEKDELNEVGAAIYRKPTSNECYEKRQNNEPPLCKESDDPDAAWSVPLQACIHKVPVGPTERGLQWPEEWPQRAEKAPYWLKSSQVGIYGKSAPEDFSSDYEHWKHVVSKSYLTGLGIDWSSVRNVMDMRAVYGGFAAALKDLKVWVMNVVPVDSPDTLPIIYERGLFGMYHDWCQSFSTYPRSYDLLHADHLFFDIKKRCKLRAVVAEIDRILRPDGHLIVRDKVETIGEIESLAKSLHWKIRLTYSKDNEGLLCVQKTMWRPRETETIKSAIA
ncbi:S-adenosyl-L-methionine-dependent methyltransferases superfamily protein [Actinidia rufa]|uniref:S-adenosyl-L-methionine-dependent methyltransferases superfamily protein n=1 Tax=Actinidia rufa TaxID=165716 RepID=A0A7J0GGL2_9ERIC|nr:S-adenosyl-L-methionine-dependent methyltransferases superfamily protein [Actinidia rufa]